MSEALKSILRWLGIGAVGYIVFVINSLWRWQIIRSAMGRVAVRGSENWKKSYMGMGRVISVVMAGVSGSRYFSGVFT